MEEKKQDIIEDADYYVEHAVFGPFTIATVTSKKTGNKAYGISRQSMEDKYNVCKGKNIAFGRAKKMLIRVDRWYSPEFLGEYKNMLKFAKALNKKGTRNAISQTNENISEMRKMHPRRYVKNDKYVGYTERECK